MQKKNLVARIFRFFDKLEDRVRVYLSERPILYTIVGGTAIVLFWRGIWHTADMFPFLTGPMSIIISVAVLLVTGLFVSYFVGDMIIISGLKKDKKLSEKTEEEIKKEEKVMERIEEKLDYLSEKVEHLEESIEEVDIPTTVDTKTKKML